RLVEETVFPDAIRVRGRPHAMTDAATEARLQELFRRESRSLLQYAREAALWAGDKDRVAAARVQELAAVECRALEGLAGFMEEEHVPLPYLGAYPTRFTDFNFIGVRALLPRLIEDQRRGVAALEHDAAATGGKAREALTRLLDVKRNVLA